MATTAFCNSAKKELLQGAHCFNATATITANTHSTTLVDNVSTMTAVSVGMAVSGSGIPANAVVANVVSATTFLLSITASTTVQTVTLTITGDVFKMALIKVGATGTYDATVTNYGAGSGSPTLANLGTDEVTSGGGYTTGGTALTNVTPSLSSGVAITQFSPNPNWTSATFSAIACEIYNTNSSRLEGVGGRTISIHDFGGTQSVSAGTFTVVMPTFSSTLALLRIA